MKKFSSYAQRGEDQILWNELQRVPRGFYIDIGAQHPSNDSVSRGFYEQGWRGVHIEPVAAYAEMLRKDRPDETVLEMAIGSYDGHINLAVFENTGLSTVSAAFATRHERAGHRGQWRQVEIKTLTSALAGIALPKDIHWMKIDVEGCEFEVLRGWDSSILRPHILVIESTEPNTDISTHELWEHLVITARYKFVKFDGLNRFYVACEHHSEYFK